LVLHPSCVENSVDARKILFFLSEQLQNIRDLETVIKNEFLISNPVDLFFDDDYLILKQCSIHVLRDNDKVVVKKASKEQALLPLLPTPPALLPLPLPLPLIAPAPTAAAAAPVAVARAALLPTPSKQLPLPSARAHIRFDDEGNIVQIEETANIYNLSRKERKKQKRLNDTPAPPIASPAPVITTTTTYSSYPLISLDKIFSDLKAQDTIAFKLVESTSYDRMPALGDWVEATVIQLSPNDNKITVKRDSRSDTFEEYNVIDLIDLRRKSSPPPPAAAAAANSFKRKKASGVGGVLRALRSGQI